MADRIPGMEHFRKLPSPLGPAGFSLSIADLCVRFEGLNAELLESAHARYNPFLSKARPLHTVTLYPGAPAYLDPSPDGFLRIMEFPLEGGRLYLSTDFCAFRAAGTETGALRVACPEDHEVTLRAMENYLRWVTADLALAHAGFILHAAGLVRAGRAYLFFGPSGAGKSTVAALSPDCTLLSDDLVLLLRREGRWMAATTPFRGTLEQEAKAPGLFPLAMLCRLVQGPSHAATGVGTAEGTATLLSSCPFVSNAASRSDMLMPLVSDCCREVGVWRLDFAKDSGFWALLREL